MVYMFVTNIPGFIDEDDLFVDAAIDMKVFDFLHHTVLENESIYKEVVYLFWFLVKWIQSSMHFMCVCRHRIIFGLCKSHGPKEIVLFTSVSTHKDWTFA